MLPTSKLLLVCAQYILPFTRPGWLPHPSQDLRPLSSSESPDLRTTLPWSYWQDRNRANSIGNPHLTNQSLYHKTPCHLVAMTVLRCQSTSHLKDLRGLLHSCCMSRKQIPKATMPPLLEWRPWLWKFQLHFLWVEPAFLRQVLLQATPDAWNLLFRPSTPKIFTKSAWRGISLKYLATFHQWSNPGTCTIGTA